MRRVILTHDWMGHSEFAWYPYIKETLEQRGFRVLIPTLPHADLPDPDEWLEMLSETIGTPGKQLTLIGHGLGGATILRYLEKAPQPVGDVILVGCAIGSLGHAEIEAFYDPPFDFPRIRQRAKSFTAFYSDHDSQMFKQAALVFKRLHADVIIQPEQATFTASRFPELVTTLLKLVYGDKKNRK